MSIAEENYFDPQPAKVRFINKKGKWETENCHDIKSCYEHKNALKKTQKLIQSKLNDETFVKTLPLGVNRKTGEDSKAAVNMSVDEYVLMELVGMVASGDLTEEQLMNMIQVR